jgi:hypothetical protein
MGTRNVGKFRSLFRWRSDDSFVGHCAPNPRDQPHHRSASSFAFERALNMLDLTADAVDTGK